MVDFADGKNILLNKTPEPGRPLKTQNLEKKEEVNVEDLADKILQAINAKLPNFSSQNITKTNEISIGNQEYSENNSMDKLAKAMIVERIETDTQRSDKIGKTKTTTKNQNDTNSTIDLLSEMGD